MGSVVTKNVEANQTVTGNFARIHQEYLKYMKYISEILKIKDVKKMKGGIQRVTNYFINNILNIKIQDSYSLRKCC